MASSINSSQHFNPEAFFQKLSNNENNMTAYYRACSLFEDGEVLSTFSTFDPLIIENSMRGYLCTNFTTDKQRYYLKVIGFLAAQALCKNQVPLLARNFISNPRHYLLLSSDPNFFQSAHRASVLALQQSKCPDIDYSKRLDVLTQATVKIDGLKTAASLATPQIGRWLAYVNNPHCKEHETFSSNMQQRLEGLPLDDLSKSLREETARLIQERAKATMAEASSRLSDLLLGDAQAIWEAGYLILATAIHNSSDIPQIELTAQAAAQIWDKATEGTDLAESDPRDFILKLLRKTPLETQSKIEKRIKEKKSALERARVFYEAFNHRYGPQYNMNDLKFFLKSS